MGFCHCVLSWYSPCSRQFLKWCATLLELGFKFVQKMHLFDCRGIVDCTSLVNCLVADLLKIDLDLLQCGSCPRDNVVVVAV